MTGPLLKSFDLTDAQFERISGSVYRICGIDLSSGKRELVRARLTKRIRKLDLPGFEEYLEFLSSDSSGDELTAMLDAISTNLTSFFREPAHFEHLKNRVLPDTLSRNERGGRRIRAWSAGCSSGEEPYTIAMMLCEEVPDPSRWDIKVLATDLSTSMLAKASQGTYGAERLRDVPPMIRSKHFECIDARSDRQYRVSKRLRGMVTFARLNLMGPWPMKGPFDFIFCRNVMIYFDKPTQSKLVNRYWGLLASGGTLFIGHSESLTGIEHRFRYVQPTVYMKP